MMAFTIASRNASTGYSYTSSRPTPRTVPATRMFRAMASTASDTTQGIGPFSDRLSMNRGPPSGTTPAWSEGSTTKVTLSCGKNSCG
jgi:hypothetical protein